MFKQFLDKIPGADVYMVTSFLIFFAFFLLVGLYLLLVSKKHVDHMAQMPLNDSNDKQPKDVK